MKATVEITHLTTQTRVTVNGDYDYSYPPPAEEGTVALWTLENGNKYVCTESSVSPADNVKYCETCSAPHPDERECWSCTFWNNVAKDPEVFVVGGNAYCAGPENAIHKGMGGTKYRVRSLHKANVELTTTNLWHRGKVPPSHQNLLPNNAYFA
jgi:hypothetical protein